MNPDDGLPGRKTSAPAVQKLSDLSKRWGVVEPETWKSAPELIRVRAMDRMETWRKREHPSAPAKTVMETQYELTDTSPIKETTDGPT